MVLFFDILVMIKKLNSQIVSKIALNNLKFVHAFIYEIVIKFENF